MNPILFIHIPKTAGTSFRKGLDQLMGDQASCRDYGVKSEETSPEVLAHMYENPDHWKFYSAFRASERQFLVGHYHLLRYGGLFGSFRSIAFVREPVQRVVSEFKHFVRNYGYTEPLSQFFLEKRFINTQSRLLNGVPLDAIGLIGITEQYKESLQLIEDLYGIRVPCLKQNIGRDDLSGDHDLTPLELEAISTVNADDVDLYRHAKTIFSRRLQAQKLGIPYVRGEITAVRRNRVIGWAACDAYDDPVTVEVSADGTCLGETVARDYRQHLKALGIGRGGYVGFNFPLPGKMNPTIVSGTVSGTGQELSTSPYQLPAAQE